MNPDNPNFRTPEEEARAAEFVRMKAEVERQAKVIDKLKSLCLTMFDTENQPPQYTNEQAMKILKEVLDV